MDKFDVDVCSISYLFHFGKWRTKGFTHPTRGIHQGDPLSSYLFLLVSKGLNGLLQKVFAIGNIKGFFLCKNGMQISHLFFTNDSLIFCRAQMTDVVTIQAILTQYELASSQQINCLKTNLFFGKSISENTKISLKEFLGVLDIKDYEAYLGLPAMVGRNKKVSLSFIKERIWSKLQG